MNNHYVAIFDTGKRLIESEVYSTKELAQWVCENLFKIPYPSGTYVIQVA